MTMRAVCVCERQSEQWQSGYNMSNKQNTHVAKAEGNGLDVSDTNVMPLANNNTTLTVHIHAQASKCG